jgi:hypothetical protein
MATNYPSTVPAAYTKHEDLQTAYYWGWRHGHGCAACNVPSIGDDIRKCADHMDLGDSDTVTAANIREYHLHLSHAGADNSRDFSPFEFTAHWLNDRPSDFEEREEGDDRPSSEAVWEAFEEGTADAIRADLAEYTDEDYGIEPEDLEDEQPEDLTGLDAIDLVNRLLDAYAAVDDLADMYMGSGDGTAADRATQRRSNLTYISVQNAVLALMKARNA